MVAEDGTVQLNKNAVNGSEPMLRLIGDLPSGTPVASGATFGWAGWPRCWRITASRPTWCKAIASRG